jgi:aspartyl/glutamyl-tRNA(Asn/Gln) amidotransferase C subunit
VEKNDVLQLCALARIDLTEDEHEEFARKFNRLLDFVDQLLAHRSDDQPSGAQLVERQSEAESLLLRRDEAAAFVWPDGFKHDYIVRQVINFEGES